jgi:hypothetical protein
MDAKDEGGTHQNVEATVGTEPRFEVARAVQPHAANIVLATPRNNLRHTRGNTLKKARQG